MTAPRTVRYLDGDRKIQCVSVCVCRYQLRKTIRVQTLLFGRHAVSNDGFVRLFEDGILEVREGFVYNGTTGVPDWLYKKLMPGATLHDGVYHLLNDDQFLDEDHELVRKMADNLLDDVWKADGVNVAGRFLGRQAMKTRLAKAAAAKRKEEILHFP